MFDAAGKLSDGIFADTMDFCYLLEQYSPSLLGGQYLTCEMIIASLNLPIPISLRGLVTLPLGNTHAYGSFDECIAAESAIAFDNSTILGNQVNPLGIENNFKGKYIPLGMFSTIDLGNLSPPPQDRMASGIAVGGIIPPIINGLNLTNPTIDNVSRVIFSTHSIFYI